MSPIIPSPYRRALRAVTYQQLAKSLTEQRDDVAKNRDLCDLILRGSADFGSLSLVESTRINFYLMGYLPRYENAYFQHKIGILTDGEWAGIGEDINSFFSRPGTRTAWSGVKNRSSPDFRTHIDAIAERLQHSRPSVASAPNEPERGS